MEGWIAGSELVRNFGLLGAAVIGLILDGMRVVAANRQANAALRQAELARRDHVAELFIARWASWMIRICTCAWAGSIGCGRLRTIFLIWPEPGVAECVYEGRMRWTTVTLPHPRMSTRSCASSRDRARSVDVTGGPAIVRPPGFVVDIHGAFVRRVDLSDADLAGSNLAGADATGANFRGANFKDANLKGTILRGADLRGARNLTREQLAAAIIDETTLLPDYLEREEAASARQ